MREGAVGPRDYSTTGSIAGLRKMPTLPRFDPLIDT
jgi:hypothetical protein